MQIELNENFPKNATWLPDNHTGTLDKSCSEKFSKSSH